MSITNWLEQTKINRFTYGILNAIANVIILFGGFAVYRHNLIKGWALFLIASAIYFLTHWVLIRLRVNDLPPSLKAEALKRGVWWYANALDPKHSGAVNYVPSDPKEDTRVIVGKQIMLWSFFVPMIVIAIAALLARLNVVDVNAFLANLYRGV